MKIRETGLAEFNQQESKTVAKPILQKN